MRQDVILLQIIIRIDEAVAAVKASDMAVVFVGSSSASLARDYSDATCGEGFDLSSLDLTGVQEDWWKKSMQ